MAADELMAGIASDRGGDEELTTLERAYIRKLGELEVCTRLLTHDIAAHGLLTPGGRVRDAYDKLLSGLDRFDRLAQRIGLARKARSVADLSIEEYVNLHRQPRGQQPPPEVEA